MITQLDGFNINEATFYTDGDLKPGMAVDIGDGFTAIVPREGTPIVGVCTSVRGNYASVALTGVVTVPYTGSGITVGYCKLSAAANGAVKADTSSMKAYLVLEVDSYEKLITIML